jgi:hypothetical protein
MIVVGSCPLQIVRVVKNICMTMNNVINLLDMFFNAPYLTHDIVLNLKNSES